MTTRFNDFVPSLPIGTLPHSRLGEVETYVAGDPEYRLTTGLLAASYTGNLSSFDGWWQNYRGRFTPLGVIEMGGTCVGLHLLNRVGMAVVHSALFAAGVRRKWPLFFLSTSVMGSLVSGVMTFYQRLRHGSSGESFLKQWGTGTLYSLPSMFLGMGLLHRWGFGKTFFQDLTVEPIQALCSATVGQGIEGCGARPGPGLSFGERIAVEFMEGLPNFLIGRAVGSAGQRFLPSGTDDRNEPGMRFRSVPRPEALRYLAAMAKEGWRKEADQYASCLKDDKPQVRAEAARALREMAETGRAPKGAIEGMLRSHERPAPPAPPEQKPEPKPPPKPELTPSPPPPRPTPRPERKRPGPAPRAIVRSDDERAALLAESRPYSPKRIGYEVERARLELGLSRDAAVKTWGIGDSNILAGVEKGASAVPAPQTVCRIAAGVRDKLKVSDLYPLMDEKAGEIDCINWNAGKYFVELPPGFTLHDLRSRSAHIVISRRSGELEMTIEDLAEQSGLSGNIVANHLSGKDYGTHYPESAKLAATLGWPPSFVHLLIRKDLLDCLTIVERKTGTVLHEPSGVFDWEGRRESFRLFASSEGERRLLEMLGSTPSKSVHQALWQLTKIDPVTGPYLELPQGVRRADLEKVDLLARLDDRRGAESREQWLKGKGIKLDTFYRMVGRETFPTPPILHQVGTAFDIQFMKLAAKYWPQDKVQIEVREFGEIRPRSGP